MFEPIPEGTVCANPVCGHKATDRLVEPSPIPHGEKVRLLCRHCRIQEQIDYVIEQSRRLPDLFREYMDADCYVS